MAQKDTKELGILYKKILPQESFKNAEAYFLGTSLALVSPQEKLMKMWLEHWIQPHRRWRELHCKTFWSFEKDFAL